MRHDFTDAEFRLFTKTEQRIIVMNKQYDMSEEQIRMYLAWPLEPLSEVTWRGHWARLMKKMAKIRLCRNAQDDDVASLHSK